jgi:hypothetical protein
MWTEDHPEVKWHNGIYTATFPSGARILFGYLDNPDDYLRYKGCDFHFVGIDQAEEIRERDYRYLLSRIRRPLRGPASLIPLRIRLTATPASDGSSDWIRKRFILEKDENRAFIPSLLTDNPGIDQDAYCDALSYLNPADRQRLEYGIWDADDKPDPKKMVLFTVLNSEKPLTPRQVLCQLEGIFKMDGAAIRQAVWDMIGRGTLILAEDLTLHAHLEDEMPITEKDVEQVRKHVEENSFYVDIDTNLKIGHPSSLVGKDLFVVSYEQPNIHNYLDNRGCPHNIWGNPQKERQVKMWQSFKLAVKVLAIMCAILSLMAPIVGLILGIIWLITTYTAWWAFAFIVPVFLIVWAETYWFTKNGLF